MTMEHTYIIRNKDPIKEMLFGGVITFLSGFILPLLILVGYYTNSFFTIIDGGDTPPAWEITDDMIRGILPTVYFGIGFGVISAITYALIDIYAPLIIFGTSLTFLFIYIYPAFVVSRHRTDTSTLILILTKEYVTGFMYFISIYIMSLIFTSAVLVPAFILLTAQIGSLSITGVLTPMNIGMLFILGIIPTFAVSVITFVTTHIGLVALASSIHDRIGTHPHDR